MTSSTAARFSLSDSSDSIAAGRLMAVVLTRLMSEKMLSRSYKPKRKTLLPASREILQLFDPKNGKLMYAPGQLETHKEVEIKFARDVRELIAGTR